MTRLLILFLLIPFICYGETKVFFKIAVDERAYSSFLLTETGMSDSSLHSLASRLKEMHFEPDKIKKEYYNIKVEYGMTYNGREVSHYDIRPILPDRFRHVLLVDEEWEHIIRREVFDIHGKLLYSYSFEDKQDELKPNVNQHLFSSKTGREDFPGFSIVFKKTLPEGTVHTLYSDGLNKFSVFISETEQEFEDSARILYGNYVYRQKIGGKLYTVVGSIPFPQMEKVVSRLSVKEDN
jgi:negative regulator of sigma E activity